MHFQTKWFGTTTGTQITSGEYLCEGVTLLSSALGLAGRVAECKNDWALIEWGHVSDDPLGEGSGYSSHTWDREQSIYSGWQLGLFILMDTS